jgi:hypothetical protein
MLWSPEITDGALEHLTSIFARLILALILPGFYTVDASSGLWLGATLLLADTMLHHPSKTWGHTRLPCQPTLSPSSEPPNGVSSKRRGAFLKPR